MSTLVLRKLALNNFKGFSGEHEFRLDRTPGLYYLTGVNRLNPELGANGVGKSTLFDALFWCLFNKTIRDARPANAVIPWEMSKGSCSVSLVFERTGRSHTLTRSRSPNSLTITRRDQVREIDQDEVAKLIGMSEETFRRTVVLGQFGSLFLDLPPERQAAMFSEALDLGLWLRAADLAGGRRKNAHANSAVLQGSIAKLEGKLEEIVKQLAGEEVASSGFERKKSEQIQGLKYQLDKYAKEIKDLYNSRSELLGSPRTGQKVSPLLPPLKDRIADLRRAQRELARRIGDGEGQLSALGARQSDCKARARAYREALASDRICPECGQRAPVARLRGKLDEAEKALKKVDRDIGVATQDGADLGRAMDSVESEIKQLEEAGAKLDSVRLNLSSVEATLRRVETEENPHGTAVAQIKARRSTTKDQLGEERAKLEMVERLIETYSYWNTAFKEIRLSIIDETLRELEMAVTRHVEALGLPDWRVEFETERTTQSGNVSVAFAILLYPPELDEPVRFESYSGGESQRLQLAVAFGLSEVLLERAGVSPNVEVLDEPTRGLSPQGIDDLLEHLRVRALELGRALYFVDHHSLDRGAFDGVITIVKDEDGAHIR